MKRTALALLLTPLLSASVLAAGYTGPNTVAPITTVAQALAADDDANVVLEGQITQRLGAERYEFKDATGTVIVEIDDEDWPAQSISETATVRLSGEVDKDRSGYEIDVDRIEVVQ